MGIQPIDTDMKGPLPRGTVGLVLGRSSSILKGLIVLPGVIDPDYIGVIKVMCQSPRGIITIASGDRIAQLLILPSFHENYPACSAAFLSLSLDDRPMMSLTVEGKTFSGLVDTGADRSIITTRDWPGFWPLQESSQTLQGLGYAQTPKVSSKELTWISKDQKGRFQPFVVEGLPFNLWGRDVQSQMKLRLTNDYSEVAQNIMLKSGFIPNRGIGRKLQGMTAPIEARGNLNRRGLGFFQGSLSL
nr:endogenous retrovirus group K member 7 Pro protein-like [Globicephala melas]